MNYTEFKETLLNELNEKVSGSEQIESFQASSSMKTNENTKDSIVPKYIGDKNVGVCIYPEELYEDYVNGISLNEITESVIGQAEYTYSHSPSISLGDLTSEAVRDNLYLQLINGDSNPLIKDNCPYIEVNDLIAVPRVKVEIDGQEGSFLVNHKIQSQMKLTDDETLSIARQNTLSQPYSLRPMSEVLSGMMGQEIPSDGIPQIYVLSNPSGINGSIQLLNQDAMSEASRIMGNESLFIIGSSIHELLLLPESMVDDPANLAVMCNDVNRDVVNNNEILTGSIYRYDSDTQKISICNNLEDLNNLQHQSTTQAQPSHHRQAM